MNCSMGDYLKVVTPNLHTDLVSPLALFNIQALAEILPSASAILECRLAAAQSQVDLILFLPCYNPTLPERFQTHPVWQFFQEFCQEWVAPTSFLHQSVKDVWLEFDVDGPPSQVPVPCIFLLLNQESVSDTQALISVARRILNDRATTQFESNLRLCADSLPEGAQITYIGAMLSRPTNTVRLNLGGISPQQLPDYLEKIGWSEPTNTLESLVSTLSDLVDEIRLFDIDVGDTVLPKIGLECFFRKQPKHEPRWQTFLDHLVEWGLCTQAKKNAFLAWPGYTQRNQAPELWPSNLNPVDLFLGSRALSIFVRRLSHVKIVYQPGTPLEAKGYLGFSHAWFDASALTKKTA